MVLGNPELKLTVHKAKKRCPRELNIQPATSTVKLEDTRAVLSNVSS